ncbi:AraC family transcriptional regulator [Bradyrhizobium sp. UNPF46]|uniref:helix-turn-helix domain-containing protein n=1 Tax=Bradyrhizobium sp. UNPF46 TaxID=1141168 RepID=UPI00114FCA4D|nr:helix-turn-helix domain-containing protein [Bradyrhizobium sp. UNPF46]TQF26452.1 AraC family transcriptional regulator [Bradyrhizobium sp. UNPF46]
MSETMSADETGRGAPALAQLRAATSGICDVIPLTADDDFHVSTATMAFGNALLIESFATALEYDRTPAHVARGGLDHYQVVLCLHGEMQFASGRREVTLRPGDICLIDMAQPNRTVLTGADDARAHHMALILPRPLLAPRLAHPDSATASSLPAGHLHARLLASQFAALWRPTEPDAGAPNATIEATIEAMADIVAGAAGSVVDVNGTIERAERHLYLAMIKRHIAANLDIEALTAQELCRRFQISRASLYRLFEDDGGLARYVQEQRLNRALMLLISPASRDRRLIDLAVDLQFSSDSTFVRAFRRQFGLTPGEIRSMSAAWIRDHGQEPGPDELLHRLGRH